MAKAHPGLDAAYAAGILDGEGCLDIHYDKRNNSFYPRVRVEMTQYETVHQRNLERIMGEKNVLKPSKTKGK